MATTKHHDILIDDATVVVRVGDAVVTVRVDDRYDWLVAVNRETGPTEKVSR